MSETEVAFFFSQIFGSYLIGFGAGYLIHFFKKLMGYI